MVHVLQLLLLLDRLMHISFSIYRVRTWGGDHISVRAAD